MAAAKEREKGKQDEGEEETELRSLPVQPLTLQEQV